MNKIRMLGVILVAIVGLSLGWGIGSIQKGSILGLLPLAGGIALLAAVILLNKQSSATQKAS